MSAASLRARSRRGTTRLLGLLIALLLGLGVPLAGFAQGMAPGSAAPAPSSDHLAAGPAQVLSRGIDRLTGFLIGARDPSPEEIAAFLDDEIAPFIDFAYMAAWAVGPYHRQLDEDRRARLAVRLRELFLGALARNLGSFSEPLPRIDIYRSRPGRGAGETIVPARVVFASGFAVRLDFRFYWTGAAWRVFDVAANGASAVAYYRRYFGDVLEHEGSNGLNE